MKNKIKYQGELDLNGFKIPCYVLENGTRVLSGRGMQSALKMVDDQEEKQSAGTRLVRHLRQKSLEPYIYNDKEQDHFEPMICWNGDSKIHGYEAHILVDICDAFMQARKNIKLSSRQEIIAEQCELLIRAFARVGIVALVDEATGYQYDRERDELQKILKAYIAEELLPWQKRFPDVFYTELFRLNRWDLTVKGINARPGVIGKWTNTLIYSQLPSGVLESLKKLVPKNEKGQLKAHLHRGLTLDVGEPNLTQQINQIITLFRVSDDMNSFWKLFEKHNQRKLGQTELPFQFDSNGHTIYSIEN